MNYLNTLKVLVDNALLNNKKFMCIPYYKHYYTILILLKFKNYIQNLICITCYNQIKVYIIIEFKYINNYIKKFKIYVFKSQIKHSIYKFTNILKLYKFSGLFIFNTSLGILTLEEIKFFKIGGSLIVYIY